MLEFFIKVFGNLYDGACILFITGHMGLSSLCILIRALSIGAMGFICINFFFWFYLLLCSIFVLFVGIFFFFGIILWDLCLIGLFDFSVYKSHFFVVAYLCVLWLWFYLYLLLLSSGCSVLVWFLFVLYYIGVFYVVCYMYLFLDFVWFFSMLGIWKYFVYVRLIAWGVEGVNHCTYP